MPTFDRESRFQTEYQKLPRPLRLAFMRAVAAMVSDLREHPGRFGAALRVKKLHGYDDIWEMTWAPDGRATFSYGEPVREGEPHITWRRIGTHDIFREP